MQRLCGFTSGMVLMAALWVGCGSTGGTTAGDDQLVFQFLHFDNTGITQADSVRETSADVDNSIELCASGQTFTTEPFTNTTINAVFHNYEAADITLDRVVIDVGPTSGLPNKGVLTRYLTKTIQGGRCTNGAQKSCGSDADCLGIPGACQHTDTTVTGILLFDVNEKLEAQDGTYGVHITFFASDPNQSLEARTNYTVVFADFDNCKKGQ